MEATLYGMQVREEKKKYYCIDIFVTCKQHTCNSFCFALTVSRCVPRKYMNLYLKKRDSSTKSFFSSQLPFNIKLQLSSPIILYDFLAKFLQLTFYFSSVSCLQLCNYIFLI